LSEVETAFIILSKDYDQIFNVIDELISNKGYRTENNGIQIIHDTYFDTKDEILKKNEIALRIRNIDKNVPKITLKILQNTTENYSERIEIENIYSKETLNQIILKINSYLNLPILKTSLKYYQIDPKLNLINLGFKVIQNRQTHRKIVNAINKSSNQTEFEFVFDTTAYISNNNNNITNIELEIESKLSKNNAILNDFVRDLKLNQNLFKYWSYNKLLTGKVIEILLDNNELKENKDYDDKRILTLSGLEKIELFIKSKNI
jgi:inorganic triphosphatase YgiF